MTVSCDLSNITRQTPLLDIKRATTPAQYSHFLRSRGPIFYWDAALAHVVTDHKLAQEVLKNPAFSADRSSFFISRMAGMDLNLIRDFFGMGGKMMAMCDGKDHERRRKAAALAIDGDLLEASKPLIEHTVSHLIDLAASKEGFDFAQEIAEPLPGIVLADIFGIAVEDRERFYAAALSITRFFGGASHYNNEEGRRANDATLYVKRFFEKLIAERRREPRRDFFTILLANQERYALSDDEIIAQAMMMVVAGQVTTSDQLNNNMYQLLTTGALPALQKNPCHVSSAIEEFSRLDPSVTNIYRMVKEESVLGRVRMSPGEVVFIATHAVNRDPDLFEDPDACRVDRPKNPHFSFGHGPHFCLGARLARLQMHSCFSAFLQRFPRLYLDEQRPAVRNHYALSFSGFSSLPLIASSQGSQARNNGLM